MSAFDHDAPACITAEQAIKMLPDRESVHTFRGGGFMCLGADWPRKSIVDALNAADVIQLSGRVATAMHHGIVIDKGGLLFIETEREFTP